LFDEDEKLLLELLVNVIEHDDSHDDGFGMILEYVEVKETSKSVSSSSTVNKQGCFFRPIFEFPNGADLGFLVLELLNVN
jgi:hypothetical protein